MTENDVLRERIRKIGDLIGRPVRLDTLEEENARLRVENAALKAAFRAHLESTPRLTAHVMDTCPECKGDGYERRFAAPITRCTRCDGRGSIPSTDTDGV